MYLFAASGLASSAMRAAGSDDALGLSKTPYSVLKYFSFVCSFKAVRSSALVAKMSFPLKTTVHASYVSYLRMRLISSRSTSLKSVFE